MQPKDISTASAVSHLECSRTGERFEAGQIHNLSAAGWPLLVRYDIKRLRHNWDRDSLQNAPRSMWRYAPLLPVRLTNDIVSLQEGFTPLHRLERLAERVECDDLWLKDEGVNPTGTFKARGLSCAISMCRELGIGKVAIPTAGNAGGALAAYAAVAGIDAYVFMPRDVPLANFLEAKSFGANVTLIDGLISDCGKRVADGKASENWFDISTLKEPYRIEGKKTMGLEAAEQFGWTLPDAIFYPTGGGVGMIRGKASEDDIGSSRRLSAHRARLRAKHGIQRVLAGGGHHRQRSACPEGAWRFSNIAGGARKQWHGGRGIRYRNDGCL